ncbi:hypothetical protein IC582_016853 [Cucumis melo]
MEDTKYNIEEKEQEESKKEIGEQSESNGEIISKPTLKARVKKDLERSRKTKQGSEKVVSRERTEVCNSPLL